MTPHGAKSLKDLLKSGKTLEVFSIKDRFLKTFTREAKKYGIIYHVIREKNSPNNDIDIIVDSDNSKMCYRIIERFHLQVYEIQKPGLTDSKPMFLKHFYIFEKFNYTSQHIFQKFLYHPNGSEAHCGK